MGNYQSNTTRSALEEFTRISSTVVNQSISRASMTCVTQNTSRIAFGEPGPLGCTFTALDSSIVIHQSINQACQFDTQVLTDTTVDLRNILSTRLEEDYVQNGSAIQGWLAAAVSIQENEISSVTQLVRMIETSISNLSDFACDAQFSSVNDQTVTWCGMVSNTSIDLSQDAVTTGIASCANKALQKAFTENTVLADIARRTDQALSVEQQGIDSLFGGFQTILYVIVAVIVLIIIGAVIYLVISRRGSVSPQSAPQTVVTRPVPPPKPDSLRAAPVTR